MLERFDRSLDVVSDPPAVWDVLLDVQRVASWIAIVGEVREVAPLERYEALLEDRLGPFKLRADLDIRSHRCDEQRRIRARASGEDRQVSSRISVEGELSLQPLERGSLISIAGSYEVMGRVATLGAGSIRKKASAVMEEFFSNAARELGAAG